ncbi:MAG: hypothetical protein H0U71_01565 [Gammaproteobacteria bacterium]|nr:hypothetical protein [Gammaproteobacteria bacterium]
MAQKIVSKRSSKMNLSRHQVALFQKIIFVGSQMAGLINQANGQSVLPKMATRYAQKWSDLMVQLAKTLL